MSIHNQKQDGVEFKRLCVFRASFARDMIEVFLVCIVYDRDGLQERTEQTQNITPRNGRVPSYIVSYPYVGQWLYKTED